MQLLCTSILLSLLCSSVSPVKMGILNAKTGVERYNILYEAHVRALEKGAQVDYSGIDTLRLEIPKKAKSIPLGYKTDFKGTVFIVNNVVPGNFFLFTKTRKADTIALKSMSDIDNGDFRGYSELRSGMKMLIIEDKNPWIKNRRGFNYGMNRRDILVLKNGKAQNQTSTVYDNAYTDASCSYVPMSKSKTTFSNVVFLRAKSSTAKTFLVKFENENNIHISNVKMVTPDGTGLYGDTEIFLKNCADVSIKNIQIEGSYSMKDKYGYGISMDNVYYVVMDNIVGDAPWGVYGNNNVNCSILKNSHVNRYDNHCYGRDFFFENCLFDKSGFLYSSIFGDVKFEKCSFKFVFPCLNRIDFNAYSPFNITFSNCDFFFDNSHYALVNLSDIDDIQNPRNELSDKCLPNVRIENCSINLSPGIEYMFAFYVGGCKYSKPIKGLKTISLNSITVKGSDIPLKLFNTNVRTYNIVDLIIENVEYKEGNNRIPNYRFVNETMLNRSEPTKKLVRGQQFVK